MRGLAPALLVAGLLSAAPATAMMPLYAYENALQLATAEAVLVDLRIRLDDYRCHVSGTVSEVRAREGERSRNYPRRRKLTEVPTRPAGRILPEPGTQLSLTLACFSRDRPPVFGAHFQFAFEWLAQARGLVVPVDRNGDVVDAFGSGVHTID